MPNILIFLYDDLPLRRDRFLDLLDLDPLIARHDNKKNHDEVR
ncbi:MAG: hypothetical protein WBQ08_17285 [Candidatus Sulfotelmatobacter sp.]